MSESKHTPTPWECGPEIDSDGRLIYMPIRSKSTRIATTSVYGRTPNGKTAGKPCRHGDGAIRSPVHITIDECRANAEFIARACNAHDDLLDIVQRLVAYNAHYSVATFTEWDEMIRDAKAVIAKAEGVQAEAAAEEV